MLLSVPSSAAFQLCNVKQTAKHLVSRHGVEGKEGSCPLDNCCWRKGRLSKQLGASSEHHLLDMVRLWTAKFILDRSTPWKYTRYFFRVFFKDRHAEFCWESQGRRTSCFGGLLWGDLLFHLWQSVVCGAAVDMKQPHEGINAHAGGF